MNAVKTVTVGKRKYFLQTNGRNIIFRETLLSGFTPCPLPEGMKVIVEPTKEGKIPYIVKE